MCDYTIYLDKKDINDATSYYISIIREAIEKNGNNCKVTHALDCVSKEDIVIVVKVTSFFRIKRRNPSQKTCIWFQGIQPEEIMSSNINIASKLFYYLAFSILEKFALKKSDLNIFVSDEMRKHYQAKYKNIKAPSFIMPCFNCVLDKDKFFTKGKYESPNFVYAGSLDNWQCINQTLVLFKEISKYLPEATLTILTKEKEKATELSKKYDITRCKIKYVNKDVIQDELAKYKFGIVLREDIAVNRVATPTKLNSYMSVGLIPIVSICLTDFIEHSEEMDEIIRIRDIEAYRTNALEIVDFNKKTINSNDIFENYSTFFNSYYNSKKYIGELSTLLKKLE